MLNIRYFNGGTLSLIFSNMIFMTEHNIILKLGRVTRLGFLVRHRSACGCNMRLVWVWATVGGEMSTRSQNWHTVSS